MHKKENLSFIFVFSLVFVLLFAFFFGKYGNPLIDTGRELFIPYAMVNLKTTLFKDKICIYGPLPYILNSFIVKIFGGNFSTFFFLGGFLAYIFCLVFYFILNMFFSPKTSLLLIFSIFSFCVFSFSPIFNFLLPYSFAILYSLVFSAFFLYFSLLFIKKNEFLYFYLAAFAFSLILLSKYDFATLLFPFLFLIFYKKIPFNKCLKSLLCFAFPFIFLIIYCFLNNVTVNDIFQNFSYILKMSKSPALIHFYKTFSGFAPNFERFLKVLSNLAHYIPFFLPPILFLYFENKNKLIFNFVLYFYFAILFILFVSETYYLCAFFCYFPFILFLIFLFETFKFLFFKKKDFNKNFTYFFTIFFTIFASFKVLFCLTLGNYGVFYLPFVILGLMLFLKKHFSKNTVLKKYFLNCSVFFIILFFAYSFLLFKDAGKYPVKTPSGIFYSQKDFEIYQNFLKTLKNLNPQNEPILGLPEGLFFNFALKQKYDIFPTSFTPMDFDTYGEDYLINEVKKANPKLIFLTSRKTTDYGREIFCIDYAEKFCRIIFENYIEKTRYDNGFAIFERK